jgi:biopolymer transport protein ExbD
VAKYQQSFQLSWITGVRLTLLLGFLATFSRSAVLAEEVLPAVSSTSTPQAENQKTVETDKKASVSTVTQAIQYYREKNYPEADKLFTQLHAENPDKTKTTYYLAITKAQEGDFPEASRLYQEVMKKEGASALGLLAQQGFRNLPLPATANVDAPPEFQQQNPYAMNAYGGNIAGNNTMGVSPTDLMWMQTMMGTNNNNGNNNSNNDWSSWMMNLDAQTNAMNGMNAGAMSLPGMGMPNAMMPGSMPMMNNGKPIDPQVMSSWLSNQMLQNSTNFMNDDSNK